MIITLYLRELQGRAAWGGRVGLSLEGINGQCNRWVGGSRGELHVWGFLGNFNVPCAHSVLFYPNAWSLNRYRFLYRGPDIEPVEWGSYCCSREAMQILARYRDGGSGHGPFFSFYCIWFSQTVRISSWVLCPEGSRIYLAFNAQGSFERFFIFLRRLSFFFLQHFNISYQLLDLASY